MRNHMKKVFLILSNIAHAIFSAIFWVQVFGYLMTTGGDTRGNDPVPSPNNFLTILLVITAITLFCLITNYWKKYDRKLFLETE
jgi:hypothetical protein